VRTGFRGELVLRGRHVRIETAALVGETQGGREGRTSAASQSFSDRAGLRPAPQPHLTTRTPITRSYSPRNRPALRVDSAEAALHGGCVRPNNLNAMPDYLPSTLHHDIHPRVLRGDGLAASTTRAHRRRCNVLSSLSPSTRAYTTSVGPRCDPTVSNRREGTWSSRKLMHRTLGGARGGSGLVVRGCRVQGGQDVHERVHLGASGGV
jgi:hypothetical protein